MALDNICYNDYRYNMNSRLRDEIHKRGPFQSLEQEAALNLLRTADALGREFDELFKRFGVTRSQYNVLRILRGERETGLACSEIGQRMIARDPDMTRLLDRLEKLKLITRCREEADRRVVKTRIKDAGLEILSRLDEPVEEAHRRQFAHMSREDLGTLVRLLELARGPAQTEG